MKISRARRFGQALAGLAVTGAVVTLSGGIAHADTTPVPQGYTLVTTPSLVQAVTQSGPAIGRLLRPTGSVQSASTLTLSAYTVTFFQDEKYHGAVWQVPGTEATAGCWNVDRGFNDLATSVVNTMRRGVDIFADANCQGPKIPLAPGDSISNVDLTHPGFNDKMSSFAIGS